MPPAATVPLPSIAAAPAVLITGSGAVLPTGVATPPMIAAGACTGTRLPLPSIPVDSRLRRRVGILDQQCQCGLLQSCDCGSISMRRFWMKRYPIAGR